MTVLLCICGERLEGSDDDLFGLLRRHSDEKHADFQLTDETLRKILDGWSQGERWDGRRRDVTGSVEVKPLVTETLDDFLAFFDRRAFMDNPFWFGCYCLEPHDIDPDLRTPKENRETKIGFVQQGSARGFLAYVNGEPRPQ